MAALYLKQKRDSSSLIPFFSRAVLGSFLWILVLTLIPLHAEGCEYYCSNDCTVEEGEAAYYYIRVINNDYPLGVSIRIEIEQNISYFEAENTEFHLYLTEHDYIHINVYTEGVREDKITTNARIFEKGEEEEDFHRVGGKEFVTTVLHPEKEGSSGLDSNNIFLAAGVFSLLTAILFYAYHRKVISIPAIRGYSILKKDKVLDNLCRREIFKIVSRKKSGITLTELRRETGITNINLLDYHLRRLIEHSYVRKVDKLYYPTGVNTKKPFIGRIHEAMDNGARTPTEVARGIRSYKEKVRYQMEKHGLLRKGNDDFRRKNL